MVSRNATATELAPLEAVEAPEPPVGMIVDCEPTVALKFDAESWTVTVGITLVGPDVSRWIDHDEPGRADFWGTFRNDVECALEEVQESALACDLDLGWEKPWAAIEPVLGNAFGRTVRAHPEVRLNVDPELLSKCPGCVGCNGIRIPASGPARACRCTCHLPAPTITRERVPEATPERGSEASILLGIMDAMDCLHQRLARLEDAVPEAVPEALPEHASRVA